MHFDQRFTNLKESLIEKILHEVRERYLYYNTCVAPTDTTSNRVVYWSFNSLKEIYVNTFKENFTPYITREIETQLWFAAQNVEFVIRTFVKINPTIIYENPTITYENMCSLFENIKVFLEIQLDDFECGNWGEDIISAMPDEEIE